MNSTFTEDGTGASVTGGIIAGEQSVKGAFLNTEVYFVL